MRLQVLSAGRRWRIAVALALATALALVVLNELAYQRSSAALTALDARVELRRDVQLMVRRLSDAESGQRGFLLTGRNEYLDPYHRSLGSVRMLAGRIEAGYRNDADAAPGVAELLAATETKLSEMETALALYLEGRHATWQELLGTNIGEEQMDAVRSAAERLFALESARIASGRDDVAHTLTLGRLGLSVMAALSALALALYLRQAAVLDASRRRHAGELQQERDRLEVEVLQRTDELSELARHLQRVREDERAHLARELHDELGALLTAAKLEAARLRRSLGGPTAESEARLKQLCDTLDRGIGLKRRIIEDLHPSALSNLGLAAALDILAREFAQRSELQVQTRLQAPPVDPHSAIAVYRLVQEALTNVAKHARARQVEVVLQPDAMAPPGLTLEVRDDGDGFDPGSVRSSRHGLSGMRHRVRTLGGRLELDSAHGRGTLLRVWLPLHGEPADAPSGR